MIIVNIIGGLGNQMFQYAAGRALSLKNDTTLALDIAGFESYKLHNFDLQRVLSHPVEVAAKADISRVLGWQSLPGIQRVLSRPGMAMFRRKGFAVEPHFHFWPEMHNLPRDCYLTGYWQSDKYFQDAASVIRADFTFQLPLVNRNAELAEQIGNVNAVSLHVRRGDYAKNPKTTATHGLCTLDYYREAIRYVSDRVEQPYFFIFSDDIAWVKDNLKINGPCQYVDHNQGSESYNDMRLMSLCRHHIVANSSFSWWGAWLNPNQEKIVIAPQNWFSKEVDIKDLMPCGWIRK